jgi:hypothetical protein
VFVYSKWNYLYLGEAAVQGIGVLANMERGGAFA